MGFKRRFYQCFGGSLATLALAISPALAEGLTDWAFDTATSELTFSLSDTVFPQFFLLSEPPRLVLDIPDTEIGIIEPEQIYDGSVQAIRVAQYTPDQVRVVIELAPDIVLAPEQADIQFDDSDGLRHWRFRPLIADGETSVAVSPAVSAPNTAGDVSLSAANLQLPEKPTTTTALPIDPYDAESSAVVSVPPLEDLPTDSGLVDEVAVDEVAVDVDVDGVDAVSPAAIATVPDLPPMTVPELEQPGSDHSAINSPVTPTVAAAPESNRASLPDISGVSDPQPEVSEVTELPRSDLPESAPVDVAVETVPNLKDVPDLETVPDLEDATIEAAPVVAAASASEASNVAEESSVAEPVSDLPGSAPLTEGLAPVELSLADVEEADETANLVWETIQQPAGNRTIVQTQPPEPLTFGQPFPSTTTR
ncbi:MAG: AMIN domain-containing protein [Cyanobacteria bacterium J06627_3]